MFASSNAAGKDEVLQTASALFQPGDQAIPGLLGELRSHRFAGFLLNDCRAVAGSGVDDELTDAQPDEVAASLLAVDREVEQR